MIVEGRLAPGARIGQAELADALGISRGSVREALRRLAGDGLVEFEVNRGFFVANVGLEGVLERLEARLLLEPAIARLAAERRDESDLAALRRAVTDERTRAHRSGSPRRQPSVPRRARRGDAQRRARAVLRRALDRGRRPAAARQPPLAAGLAGGRRRRARRAARGDRGTRRRPSRDAHARARRERVAPLVAPRRLDA